MLKRSMCVKTLSIAFQKNKAHQALGLAIPHLNVEHASKPFLNSSFLTF